MPLLRRRSEFSARGPIAPWWRRPGVLAVVGLLVVGGALTASGTVVGLIASRQVREVTAAVRAMPLPDSFAEWTGACGLYGIRCAQSGESPQAVVEAVAAVLRELGHDVDAARCGTEARIDPGTTLSGVQRHESQCTTTTPVTGGVLTVAAWDFVPPAAGDGREGLALGRTAVVVEWDSGGVERLLQSQPGLTEARFGDVRITPEEIAALPGEMAEAECVSSDADGCLVYEVVLEGPGERRELLEARAAELLDAGFLVTTFECHSVEVERECRIYAESGREGGELTRIGMFLVVDRERPGQAKATFFTA